MLRKYKYSNLPLGIFYEDKEKMEELIEILNLESNVHDIEAIYISDMKKKYIGI